MQATETIKAISNEQVLEILKLGVQAPSADNLQPWRFALIPQGFIIFVEAKNLGKFLDSAGVATQLTCGAVLENISQYAASLGWGTQIGELENELYLRTIINPELYNTSGVSKRKGENFERCVYVKVSFVRQTPVGDPELVKQKILNRHTDRNLYLRKRLLPKELLAALQSEVAIFNQGHELVSYATNNNIKKLRQIVSAGDTVRFTNRRSHEEFGQVLRWNPEALTANDGLTEDTLALDTMTLSGLKNCVPWSRQKWMNFFGLHYLSVFRASWLLMWASADVLALVHHGKPNYVECGQVMQKVWLKANELGLSVQPLGALPLFFARATLLDGVEFTLPQKIKINKLLKKFQQITSGFNSEQDQLLMLFRVGYVNKPAPRSRRRPIEEFIKALPGSVEF